MQKGTSYIQGTKVQDMVKGLTLDCWGLEGKRAMCHNEISNKATVLVGKRNAATGSEVWGSAQVYEQGSASEAQAMSRGAWDQR